MNLKESLLIMNIFNRKNLDQCAADLSKSIAPIIKGKGSLDKKVVDVLQNFVNAKGQITPITNLDLHETLKNLNIQQLSSIPKESLVSRLASRILNIFATRFRQGWLYTPTSQERGRGLILQALDKCSKALLPQQAFQQMAHDWLTSSLETEKNRPISDNNLIQSLTNAIKTLKKNSSYGIIFNALKSIPLPKNSNHISLIVEQVLQNLSSDQALEVFKELNLSSSLFDLPKEKSEKIDNIDKVDSQSKKQISFDNTLGDVNEIDKNEMLKDMNDLLSHFDTFSNPTEDNLSNIKKLATKGSSLLKKYAAKYLIEHKKPGQSFSKWLASDDKSFNKIIFQSLINSTDPSFYSYAIDAINADLKLATLNAGLEEKEEALSKTTDAFKKTTTLLKGSKQIINHFSDEIKSTITKLEDRIKLDDSASPTYKLHTLATLAHQHPCLYRINSKKLIHDAINSIQKSNNIAEKYNAITENINSALIKIHTISSPTNSSNLTDSPVQNLYFVSNIITELSAAFSYQYLSDLADNPDLMNLLPPAEKKLVKEITSNLIEYNNTAKTLSIKDTTILDSNNTFKPEHLTSLLGKKNTYSGFYTAKYVEKSLFETAISNKETRKKSNNQTTSKWEVFYKAAAKEIHNQLKNIDEATLIDE